MSHVVVDKTKLSYLRGSVNNRIVRIAMNKAAVPIKDAIVAEAPSDKGHIRKSIRIKPKFYQRTQTWVAVVGVSTAYKRIKPKAKAKKAKKSKARKPYVRKTGLQKKVASFVKAVKPVTSRVRKFGLRVVKRIKKRYFGPKKRYIQPSKYAPKVNKDDPFVAPAVQKAAANFTRDMADKIKEEMAKVLNR